MKRKVEFIESYIKVGNDYQWNDNHGELIRCKDCKHWIFDGVMFCERFTDASLKGDDFCSYGER